MTPKKRAEVISSLKKKARSWGGDLIELSEDEFEELLDNEIKQAPFTSDDLGINWKKKIVYFSGDVDLVHICHEMGHIFGTRHRPYDSDELEFLGWEFLLAREVGIPFKEWRSSNEEYGINDEDGRYTELGRLSDAKVLSIVECSIEKCRKLGSIESSKLVPLR